MKPNLTLPGLAENLAATRSKAAELEALRQSRKSFLFPAPGFYREVDPQYPHKPYDLDDEDIEAANQLCSFLDSLPNVQALGTEFLLLSANFPSKIMPKEVSGF